MRNAVLAVTVLSFTAIVWAADPAVGTWKLSLEKSKFSPGPPPTSATVTYEDTDKGIKRTGQNVDPNGKATSFEYVAQYDGADYAVKGSEAFNTITLKKVDDRTVEATLKKDGKVVSKARRTVSADGKTLTIEVNGMDAYGQNVHNTMVHDKQ